MERLTVSKCACVRARYRKQADIRRENEVRAAAERKLLVVPEHISAFVSPSARSDRLDLSLAVLDAHSHPDTAVAAQTGAPLE